MNKIHFISYGDNGYTNSKKRIKREAEDFGCFSSISIHGPEDLDSNFVSNFKSILNRKRGGGYWIWKPYLIGKKLSQLKEGEFLVYLDAGFNINSRAKFRFFEYLGMLEDSKKGMISFKFVPDSWRTEKKWTTGQIFSYFGVEEDKNITDTGQHIGGAQVIQKKEHSEFICKKWIDTLYADPELFTDSYNQSRINENTGFIENRHDQSIISVLRKKYGSIVLSDETKFPNGTQSMMGTEEQYKYPFWASRLRN